MNLFLKNCDFFLLLDAWTNQKTLLLKRKDGQAGNLEQKMLISFLKERIVIGLDVVMMKKGYWGAVNSENRENNGPKKP